VCRDRWWIRAWRAGDLRVGLRRVEGEDRNGMRLYLGRVETADGTLVVESPKPDSLDRALVWAMMKREAIAFTLMGAGLCASTASTLPYSGTPPG
jgi:hypothetical protein